MKAALGLSIPLDLSASLGLSVTVLLCNLVFIFPVLFLCRELATDRKKLRENRSVKTIDDGVRSWFRRLLTFLPDVRFSFRVAGNDRITVIILCREFHRGR